VPNVRVGFRKDLGPFTPEQSARDQVQAAPARPQLSGRRQSAIVGALLLLYVLIAVSAASHKSPTFDEIQHLTLGYLYWAQPDSHLISEAGIFAQAWAALPLLADHLRAPKEMTAPWSDIGSWEESHRFFYALGNDPSAMLFQGRIMISLLGATLGGLIFLWSAKLFGALGGLVSLSLFIFCPNMLAHGALVTADMAGALGFFAATFSFWTLSHTVSWRNLLFSLLAVCCLTLAKMSAVLILPIFALVLTVRFFSRRPVEFQLFTEKILGGRLARAGIWSSLLLLHLIVVVGILWVAYDFRCASDQETVRLQILGSPNFSFWNGTDLRAFILEQIQHSHLLPPAYLEGLSFTLQASDFRSAFLCGEYSEAGWWWFFPIAFLIKTPIASLLLFVSSFLALILWCRSPHGREERRLADPRYLQLYDLSPLLILGGVYALVCLTSHLNVGLRHILPCYPVLFVLAGANTFWLTANRFLFKLILAGFLAGTMIESLLAWPNYLAFFNQLVGSSRNGYRYLVDSSLDWGQDLPDLQQWLVKNLAPANGTPVYLSYFGTGDPKFYGINALLLPSYPDLAPAQTFPLQGGIYCLSATMLQGVYSRFHPPWTSANETLYGQTRTEVNRWNLTANDSASRDRLLQEHGSANWDTCISLYGELRLARLCVYLRHRIPDAEVNYSILIYHLSDTEVQQAIGGAGPE
jgi:hypothetical protein